MEVVQTFSRTCGSSFRLRFRSLRAYMLKSSTIILSISFSSSHSWEPRCLRDGYIDSHTAVCVVSDLLTVSPGLPVLRSHEMNFTVPFCGAIRRLQFFQLE